MTGTVSGRVSSRHVASRHVVLCCLFVYRPLHDTPVKVQARRTVCDFVRLLPAVLPHGSVRFSRIVDVDGVSFRPGPAEGCRLRARDSSIIDVTSPAHYESLINAKEQAPTMVYYTATWCQPCRDISPYVKDVARAMTGSLRVLRVDVADLPNVGSSPQCQGGASFFVSLRRESCGEGWAGCSHEAMAASAKVHAEAPFWSDARCARGGSVSLFPLRNVFLCRDAVTLVFNILVGSCCLRTIFDKVWISQPRPGRQPDFQDGGRKKETRDSTGPH